MSCSKSKSKVMYDFFYKQNHTQQIRSFITVVQEGTFAKASAKLRRSTSTIFAQVKSLETQLGTTLFRKEGRNTVLTEEGEAAYEQCLPMHLSFENIQDNLAGKRNRYTRVLRISSHYVFLRKVLPPSLAKVFQKDIKRKMTIDSATKYDAFKKLEDGKIDVAFFPCDARDIREYKNLKFEKLAEYRMCGAFGHGFHFTQHMVNNLYEYFDEFRVLLPKNHVVSKRAMENIAQLEKTAAVTVDTDNMEILKDLAKQNVGTLFCDDRLFTEEDKKDLNILYLPKDETFNLHYYAITRKDTQMKQCVEELLSNVRKSNLS